MPGQSDMKTPCGRTRFCEKNNCPHVSRCRSMQKKEAPGKKAESAPKRCLAWPANVVYVYDGSFVGFLCCVHESVYTHELPAAIFSPGEGQPSLFEQRWVESDAEKASRVRASIPKKISNEALLLVETVFLSCIAEKELVLLRFLLLGYREGGKVASLLGHREVAPVLAAERHLLREAHLLKGFVRFSDYDGVLAASITPKNFVLPFLQEHFVARYSEEDFIIYDKAHKAALLFQNQKADIMPMEDIQFPAADDTEQGYRALWKQFYHTIAIEARYNPKCRRTMMPKRYWENMTEMMDLL